MELVAANPRCSPIQYDSISMRNMPRNSQVVFAEVTVAEIAGGRMEIAVLNPLQSTTLSCGGACTNSLVFLF